MTGFSNEQVFIKRLLKKLKVKVNVFSREQYKNTDNDVVRTHHPPVVRQAIRAVLQLQLEQVVEDVAKDKDLSFSQVRCCYCSRIPWCMYIDGLTVSVCICMPLCLLLLSCVPQCGCCPFSFQPSDCSP